MKYIIKIVPLDKSEDNSNVTDIKCELLSVKVSVVCFTLYFIYILFACTLYARARHSFIYYCFCSYWVEVTLNIKRLQLVQNSVARAVLNNCPDLSTSELLHSLHWLPVESRIAFKIAAITYKVLTTDQPNYLRELLNYYTPHRTLRSANQQLLEQPCVSTEFGKRSFSYLTPKIWNNLPLEIRLSSTYHTFKIRLKRFLFT